ncbi:MAG TPA: glycoside hydrolase 43 family protein, partial [Cytophagales bacterium]|nr:glycoside hydrolase 43 family protein [Cytophagales bacterium]
MSTINNPILPGFHPDPSIIRVGTDYYLAVSTFEWFPGVQLFHSKDLANWELIGHALTRTSQLDMLGVGDSCGVWAPCLTYHEDTFYLVFSNVKNFDGLWKDTPNYLVTTQDIRGEWSEPIFLSASGFDGSMFHDEDGKKWFTSMLLDHRDGKFFGGILLQEYDVQSEKLVGSEYRIFEGSDIGITEGPHIYKKDGYYHLITAEGGTEYGHAVSQARSKAITGPYEIHPENPIISSSHQLDWPLQKAGHGDIVDTPSGDWYAVCLIGRPLPGSKRCTLG